jgi:hypothetical protein
MSFALDQVSGSPLLRGAKTVGHNEDLSLREVGVRAAVRGTGNIYGSASPMSRGRVGGEGEVQRRRVNNSPCLRTRLRWPNSRTSRLFVLSHLCLNIRRMLVKGMVYARLLQQRRDEPRVRYIDYPRLH